MLRFLSVRDTQKRKCFGAETCDFGRMTAQQQLKAELACLVDTSMLGWLKCMHLWPVIPMHALGDFGQIAPYSLPFQVVREILDCLFNLWFSQAF